MHRLFLTTLSFLAILIVVSPTVVFAVITTPKVGPSFTTPVSPSQTPAYKASYVPCGTDDIKDASGKVVIRQVDQPDGTKKTVYGDGVVDNPCGFSDVIVMAKRLITGWIVAGVTFATMGFAYAGYLYITAMGSQEKISHAHSIFTKTILGFVFMLSAWLIAYTMQNIFLTEEAKKNSFLQP